MNFKIFKLLSLILPFLHIALPVFAEDLENSQGVQSEQILPPAHPEVEKRFNLGVYPIGLAPLPSYGLQFGVKYSEHQTIELNYLRSSQSYFFLSFDTKYIVLSYKHRFSRSFHGNIGFGYREYRGSVGLESDFISERIASSISANTLGVETSIGNRWNWDWFYLGVDWLGIFIPVTKKNIAVEYQAGAKQKSVRAAERKLQRFAHFPTPIFLKMELGLQF